MHIAPLTPIRVTIHNGDDKMSLEMLNHEDELGGAYRSSRTAILHNVSTESLPFVNESLSGGPRAGQPRKTYAICRHILGEENIPSGYVWSTEDQRYKGIGNSSPKRL
jgi:hypothetical protein